MKKKFAIFYAAILIVLAFIATYCEDGCFIPSDEASGDTDTDADAAVPDGDGDCLR